MTYAIETYFIPPTNYRGSCIAARVMERGTGWAGDHKPRRIILNWDHALNPSGNHMAAAFALAQKLEWSGSWVEGGGDDGASIWVNSDRISASFYAGPGVTLAA